MLGGSCLEYNSEAGATKYLLGTEQGIPMGNSRSTYTLFLYVYGPEPQPFTSTRPPFARPTLHLTHLLFTPRTQPSPAPGFNSKNKRQNNGVFVYDTGPGCSGRHHGPIVSLQRNPIHTKFFLTVGDWCARIWQEDAKVTNVGNRPLAWCVVVCRGVSRCVAVCRGVSLCVGVISAGELHVPDPDRLPSSPSLSPYSATPVPRPRHAGATPAPRRTAQTPLMSTKYHDAYLTGGCWSPTRPGVFYLIRKDGMLSVWDYNLQQYVASVVLKV